MICDNCGGHTFHASAHVTTLAVIVFVGEGGSGAALAIADEVLVDRAQADATVAEWGAITCVSCGMEPPDHVETKGRVMATRVVENASTPWRVIENYTSY